MEMEYNMYQPEFEVTDPKILKAQKQVFALGLSGILLPFGSWFGGSIIYIFIRMFLASLFELDFSLAEFCIVLFTPWIVGMILGLIAMIKGKKLKKVRQLKGKSIAGYVLGNISFWWGIVTLIPFAILFIIMVSSGQMPIPGGV